MNYEMLVRFRVLNSVPNLYVCIVYSLTKKSFLQIFTPANRFVSKLSCVFFVEGTSNVQIAIIFLTDIH